LLTLLTNYLYSSLEEKEFLNLALFLSLLSKEMLAMEAIREICRIEETVAKEEEKAATSETPPKT